MKAFIPVLLWLCQFFTGSLCGANTSPQRAVFLLLGGGRRRGSSHSARFILWLALCLPFSARASKFSELQGALASLCQHSLCFAFPFQFVLCPSGCSNSSVRRVGSTIARAKGNMSAGRWRSFFN